MVLCLEISKQGGGREILRSETLFDEMRWDDYFGQPLKWREVTEIEQVRIKI